MPQAHFEGVEEHGYVSYWETIGQADLGDGLRIPVNINFNSHRQSASPTLGQGWEVALLESHVEPVDENSMRVIMPDGWIFTFLRNGNTDTWRGNAGWAGQTDGARFTITAPCGWRVKFDTGKIQEIDTPKNRTITIKYNGPAPTEADIDNTPFVQVESNTATGVAQSITIGGQKISISQAPRPRISSIMGKTLLTGFDPALSALQYPDGQKETFDFSAPASLTPTLVITKPNRSLRSFTWDPATTQIKTDGQWTYQLTPGANGPIDRTNGKGQREYYFCDSSTGTVIEQGTDGLAYISKFYVNAGVLSGEIREVIQIENHTGADWRSMPKSAGRIIYRAAYNEKGVIIREQRSDGTTRVYNAAGDLVSITYGSEELFARQFDAQNRVVYQSDAVRDITVKSEYISRDEHIDRVYHGRTLLYTRDIKANKVVSFQE